MRKKDTLHLAVAIALMSAAGFASAASTSANITVSASVSQACSISANLLQFGAYDPVGANVSAPLNATGQVSVTCSKGASSLTLGMNAGAHPAGAQRQMIGSVATNLLNYNLFQPPSSVPATACTFPGTIAWTDAGAGLLHLTSAPSKLPRLYNVCGSIPGGQDVGVDTYTDTVSVTLNF
jgi:spore coat protein U-like protein